MKFMDLGSDNKTLGWSQYGYIVRGLGPEVRLI